MSIAMDLNHPAHAEVEKEAKSEFYSLGLPTIFPSIEIGKPEEAKPYLDMGFRHFALGVDMLLLLHAMTDSVNGFKNLFAPIRKFGIARLTKRGHGHAFCPCPSIFIGIT